MSFGANILNNAPSRWTLTNATMDTSKITLGSSSSAKTSVLQTELNVVPEELYLRLVADNYGSAYSTAMRAEVCIEYVDGTFFNALSPISNVEHGIFETVLHPKAGAYKSLTVCLASSEKVTITEWYMAGPVADDNAQLIDELKDQLPNLLYDYNTRPFKVGIMEETVALISAYLVADADLSGHLQLTYTASASAIMTIRIKDNETSELFTPMLFSVSAGSFSIGIPHAYLTRKVGYHTFTVSAQVSAGELKFDTRSIMYTIDGAHLAYRLMDVGMRILDVTLKRLATSNEVSDIYAIGVDDGAASVRCRPYSNVANTAWEPKLIIGAAKDAAIEFNGCWSSVGTAYEFVTDDEPWLFWVAPDNSLKARHYDIDDTLITLAAAASSISAVRGWKSTIGEYARDQGLIVAYLDASNNAKYRAYSLQADKQYIWEEEHDLTFSAATLPLKSLRSFRTNDFRVGFTAKDNAGDSHTIISKRYWPGNMLPSEVVDVALTLDTLTVTKINYTTVLTTEYVSTAVSNVSIDVLYAGTTNKFISVKNVGNNIVEFTTLYPFGNAFNLILLDLVDLVALAAVSVTKVSHSTYRADFTEFGYFLGNAKLSSTGTNQLNNAYKLFEATFTPVGLLPPTSPPPTIVSITNIEGGA